MPTYRKRPIYIEAFKLGEIGQPTPAPEWFGSPEHHNITDAGIILQTLEGAMLASWGDYIIKGVEGEIYACKPQIFEKTYEYIGE